MMQKRKLTGVISRTGVDLVVDGGSHLARGKL
jgi:hypothetical protein